MTARRRRAVLWRRRSIAPALVLGAFLATAQPAAARGKPKVDLSADVRLRLEQDWDGTTATGARRPDRLRARVRVRVNASIDLGDGLRVFGRVRTGGGNSQQNANITFADFDGNIVDRLHVVGDRYSLAWQKKTGGIEAGRMAFPFFTQNEYFWDGDINPLGLAANVAFPIGKAAKLKISGGGFKLPVGLTHYSGSLFAGQAVLISGPATLAAGLFRFDADRRDPYRLILLDGNGGRDYSVFALSAQYKLPAAGKPLTLGIDFYRNLQGYAGSADPVSHANDNRRTGFVVSGAWGDAAAARHFQLGYRYFRIEKLAVDASYSHDDVARLGTASQAALTDLRGSDIYANYAVTKTFVVGVRTMLTKRLSTAEANKRVRLDLIYSF